MKSRQKFTVGDRACGLRSKSECVDLSKRKIHSNNLIQKNYTFLQTYNNLFRKGVQQQIGDADNFFKRSLRNEPFDLIRELPFNKTNIAKSVKSLENICRSQRKSRTKHTLPSILKTESKKFKEFFKEETAEKLLDKDEDTGKFQKKEEFFEIFSSKLTSANTDSESDSISKILDQVDQRLEDAVTDSTANSNMAEEEETIEEGAVFNTDEPVNESPPEQDGQADDSPATDYETEDDEMKEVEEMIEAASEQLQQVVEENEKMMEALEGDEEMPEGDGSIFKYDAAIDNAVLRELEEAENQAKQTAAVINELRCRVAELLKKEKMSETEAKELEDKNKELKLQMQLFEDKIKRIQFLIAQTNLFESMVPPCGPLQTKHPEDVLPKVVVCGFGDNNMPKIIVCNDRKKMSFKCTKRNKSSASPKSAQGSPTSPNSPVGSPRSNMARKLNECICMQEKLVAKNADLEGQRYQLQSDVINKDYAVEVLQNQLVTMQNEMKIICQENIKLNEKLQTCQNPQCRSRNVSPAKQGKASCGKGKGICPADVETRLEQYSKNTETLEKHLGNMECEIKSIQKELIAVQKEREHLEHHRKMLCPPPVTPCPPPCPASPCFKPSAEQQLRELREQYSRLQDDFKNKLIEVSGLRADNEKLKEATKNAEEAKKALEDKIKDLDNELKRLKGDSSSKKGIGIKEKQVELEQQLNVAKQRFREAQDELEELRALVEDQKEQINDYRSKYLDAQQEVEEQRRQIDLMEVENQRVSEQVNLEIQRVKNQFQEKLQELMPLPDMLKATQLKLQEAQQMHMLAERNNEAMSRELQMYKDKVEALNNQMLSAMSDQALGADEKTSLSQKVTRLEEQLEAAEERNRNLKNELDELKEQADEHERLADERLHEIAQLESQLENVREESARQIARIKDRCEVVRKSMQNQICDLERQMAQSKAMAKSAQKDRDDIRMKMQAQIGNLNENFEDAQMRIKSLQAHVNFLKNTYGDTAFTAPQGSSKPCTKPDPCTCPELQ